MRDKDLRKKPDEVDLDFARRAFFGRHARLSILLLGDPWIVTCRSPASTIDPIAAGWRSFRGDATGEQDPRSASHRTLAKSEDPNPRPAGRVSHQCHAKGEFYAKDVGWVPVDLSGAVEFDKTPDGLLFFGHEKGNFLTLQLDYDLSYDSGLTGMKTARHLQNARFHVKGEGNLNSVKIDHSWQVETLAEQASK